MASFSGKRRDSNRGPARLLALALCFLPAFCALQAQRFSAPVTITLGDDPAALLSADFTGKGSPELLALSAGATTSSATVQVIANSAGNLGAASTVATAGSAILAMPVRPGLSPDLYWIGLDGSNTTLVRAVAQQNGGYAPGAELTTWSYSNAGSSKLLLAAGGLHAGYRAAVIVADATNNDLHTLLPNPDGTWAVQPLAGQAGLPLIAGATQLLTADLNGDGVPDLLVAGTTGVQVFLATGTSTNFTGFVTSTTYPCTGNAQSMALADMDGDGHADLLVEGANGRIDIYHGDADGTFAAASEVGTGAEGASTGRGGRLVGVTDVNGDGIPDLVLVSGQSLTVLLGTGSRNYQLAATYALGSSPTSFVFADLIGDGKLDIAFDSPQGVSVMFAQNAAPQAQLTASPEPSLYGANITLTLQFPTTALPSPTGTVNFSVDGAAVGSGTIGNNQATYTISAPTYIVGQHTIQADYAGDTNYGSATFTGTHMVQGLPTTTTITDLVTPIYYGQEIGYTNGIDAVISVNPTDPSAPPLGATLQGGLIYVYLDGLLVCSLTDGSAGPTGGPQRCNDANFMGYGAGIHMMVGAYQGNNYYAPSTSVTYTVQVVPDDTATTLASSLTPAPQGSLVTLTATITAAYATPVGTVQFFDGATLLGTAAVSVTTGTFTAAAVFSSSTLAVGSHAITADYIPTPIPTQDPPRNFNPSGSGLTQVIYAVPALTLTSSLNPSTVGQAVTFTAATASSSSVTTGFITFSADGQQLTTVPLSAQGSATYTTSTLSVGSHAITAVYSLTGNNPVGAGASLTQVVNIVLPTDFTLSVTPAVASVGVGNTGLLTVTVTESGTFQEPVVLSCSGLPQESTCNFATPTIAAGGGTTQLSLHIEAPHNCGSSHEYFVAGQSGKWALGLAVFTGMFFGVRRRRRLFALFVILSGILLTMNGCGWGNCTDLGTRPGTYTFTVTGVSTGTSLTRSQNVTVRAFLYGE